MPKEDISNWVKSTGGSYDAISDADGYKVYYLLTSTDTSTDNIYFGFDEDESGGYFGIEVIWDYNSREQRQEEGESTYIYEKYLYERHGAGYWPLNDEEIARENELDELYESLKEEGLTEEEINA